MQIESTNEFPPSSAVAVPAPPAQRIGPAQGSEEGAFSRLLSPIRVGTFELPNRVVMGSMHMSFYDARAQERLAEFYAERARAGVALIVTGGVGVNAQARLNPHAETLTSAREVHEHQPVTSAVHEAGSRILLQLIHAGRYAQHDDPVAPSAVASPLSGVVPREMTSAEVDQCADDFARAALLARQAGYDGVELMGAEG
jgi:2,4-dienoyl-CoA reductase (NADPH2)